MMENKKCDKQSPTTKAAIGVLEFLIAELKGGKCTEEEISDAMVRFHPSSHGEYINPDDYCNYDEACKILHLGYNRGKLNELCKAYGIKNYSVKNRPMGFKKAEINRLKELLADEVREREKKELRKKGQRKFLW